MNKGQETILKDAKPDLTTRTQCTDRTPGGCNETPSEDPKVGLCADSDAPVGEDKNNP